MNKNKKEKRQIRKKRARAKIFGTKDKPRISVFRSNKHIYAQIVDDASGKTLVSVNDLDMIKKKKTDKTEKKMESEKVKDNGTKIENAFLVGEKISEIAKKKKISSVVFDKSGYKYHGRVKAVAEGARKGGLKF